MSDERNAVTELLGRWQDGDCAALDELLTSVYAELKRLAKNQLHRDGSATIAPTELVAEAYLKLVDIDQVDWQGRAHFMSIAARTMRRVLVERYRHRQAARRDAGHSLLALSAIDQGSSKAIELERLDDALDDLARLDPRQAEIVTLRFFGGLDSEQIAAALDISPRTVKREWAAAKLWLRPIVSA